MAVTRRYLCDCGYEWTRLHFDRSDPVPDCPMCEARENEVRSIPGTFAITGVKSKAIDFVQKMAEEDYGLTDMNDNSREGDIAAKAPRPVQSAEMDASMQQLREHVPELNQEQAEAVKTFWGGGAPPSPHQTPAEQAFAALPGVAMASAAQTREGGSDPMELLHKGQKATGGRMKLDVVGRSRG